jgi:hypothetical protein
MLSTEGRDVSEKMADWIIDELRSRTAAFKKVGAFIVYNGDVVKSDSAVPDPLKEALKMAVQPLENVTQKLKDYHPGSDELVLDLVHPSLYPLIYGRSRILPDRLVGLEDCVQSIGLGEIIPVANIADGDNRFSTKFQWLPCDVKISPDSEDVRYVVSLSMTKTRTKKL